MFFKWAKPGLFLFISFFSHDKYSTNLTINDKSIDGVLGTRTLGGRMLGADESTELWRHPKCLFLKMGHSRPLFMFYATELWRYPKHDTMFALNTWYNFFLNDRPKLVKLVSSVPVKPIKAIFFGQQITSQSSDQRVGSRTGDRRKRFHTFQISRHFCSTVFCREMEYIERASCNTFYTFQNKHKSISIYRILRCCVLKKIKM